MPSAKAVANYFVEQGIRYNAPVTQLKLQKLMYYSYAWYVAYNQEQLFPEDIEAWRHGPVVRSVWQEFRRFGSSVITEPATEFEGFGVGAQFVIPRVEDQGIIGYLLRIWNTYKEYSAIQLSNMTHSRDEPWASIRPLANAFNDHPVIPPELIFNYFSRKLHPQDA